MKYLLDLPLSGLIIRYAELQDELASLHSQLSLVLVQEKDAWWNGYLSSASETLTGRDRDADFNARDLTKTRFEINGQIKALEEERSLVLFLLDRDNARADR